MRIKYLIIISIIALSGVSLAEQMNFLPPEWYLPHTKDIYKTLISSSQRDMKYHDTPYYYWTLSGKDWCLAVHFCPKEDYRITSGHRVKTIGQMGYLSNGSAIIYLTSKYQTEPNCSPDTTSGAVGWRTADYGPYQWHINYT
ncbi:MAG: hypothetical protein ACUVWP_09505 [bacterium]